MEGMGLRTPIESHEVLLKSRFCVNYELKSGFLLNYMCMTLLKVRILTTTTRPCHIKILLNLKNSDYRPNNNQSKFVFLM